MKALVVGYGSIGSRHARILSELGCDVSVVSSRRIDAWPCHDDLGKALEGTDPGYIVLANGTKDHHAALERLARLGYAGLVLVEKPLFHALLEVPKNGFKRMFVAYNLRFHPVLQELRKLIGDESILCASTYAGQYLPEWRPGSDYRSGYSASRASGGGVLRDLSHEIDYTLWLLGAWQAVTALGGHVSRLEIDSDDVFSLMLVTDRCPIVNIQVNYLDRCLRREMLLITDHHTFKADLARNMLEVDGESTQFQVDRDATYRMQHRAVMDDQAGTLCSVAEGMQVLRLIESAERASRGSEWIAA